MLRFMLAVILLGLVLLGCDYSTPNTTANIAPPPIRTDSPEPLQNRPESPPIFSATESPPIVTESPESTTESDPKTLVGRVLRVMDGDTILFVDDAKNETIIRMDGIDAPESDQRFGQEAKAWLAHEVRGEKIRAEVVGVDRYQRSLANLYVGDRWLNLELVKAGLAWHYVKYSQDIRLATAQNEARSSQLGLWQDARKVAPWDYRNGVRVETALPVDAPSTRETDTIVYVSPTGTKYHRQNCRTINGEHTAIPLSRAKSAYEPCKVCNP